MLSQIICMFVYFLEMGEEHAVLYDLLRFQLASELGSQSLGERIIRFNLLVKVVLLEVVVDDFLVTEFQTIILIVEGCTDVRVNIGGVSW